MKLHSSLTYLSYVSVKARVRIACQGSTKEAVPFLLDLLAQVENKFRIELVMFLCKVLLLVILSPFFKSFPFFRP